MRREGEDLVEVRLSLMIGSWRKEVVGNIIYQSAEVPIICIYYYWMNITRWMKPFGYYDIIDRTYV